MRGACEQTVELPFRWDLVLSLVSRPEPASGLRSLASTLARELGLSASRRTKPVG